MVITYVRHWSPLWSPEETAAAGKITKPPSLLLLTSSLVVTVWFFCLARQMQQEHIVLQIITIKLTRAIKTITHHLPLLLLCCVEICSENLKKKEVFTTKFYLLSLFIPFIFIHYGLVSAIMFEVWY